jgi:hypothetical protein
MELGPPPVRSSHPPSRTYTYMGAVTCSQNKRESVCVRQSGSSTQVMISAVTCRDPIASTSFPTIVRILIIQSDSPLYDCARTAERRLVTSDDMAHLELEDEHGTTAYVHVSFVDAAPLTHRIEALGSKGRLTIDGNRLRGAQLPAIDDSVLVENEQADVRFHRERDRHRQRERERERERYKCTVTCTHTHMVF